MDLVDQLLELLPEPTEALGDNMDVLDQLLELLPEPTEEQASAQAQVVQQPTAEPEVLPRPPAKRTRGPQVVCDCVNCKLFKEMPEFLAAQLGIVASCATNHSPRRLYLKHMRELCIQRSVSISAVYQAVKKISQEVTCLLATRRAIIPIRNINVASAASSLQERITCISTRKFTRNSSFLSFY